MKAPVVNVQRFSLHDGPGIRSLVFFKGCPLRCQWCANPECLSATPELGFSQMLCDACGECLDVCPRCAISGANTGKPVFDRAKCDACGICGRKCPKEAITIYGRDISIEEVFDEVRKDEIFYRGSGGGVTVSGGEPLVYTSHVMHLFTLCKDAGISTALETSGFSTRETMTGVLSLTDFVCFDLKMMDDVLHLKLTGKSNALILENARLVAQSGVGLQFRLPLVPGVNDDLPNIKAVSEFILSTGKRSIELMPYHRLGVGKYQALERTYALEGLAAATPEQVEQARLRFEEFGLQCLVSR